MVGPKNDPWPEMPKIKLNKKKIITVISILAVLGFIIILFSGFNEIGAGERAVVFHNNGQLTVLSPGKFQFIMPVFNTVTIYNVQSQVDTVKDASAASVDGLDVFVDVTVQYHPDPIQIAWLHQNIGGDYLGKLIRPAALEGLKASISQYHALEVLRNRAVVKDKVENVLQARLTANHLILDQVSLTNIHFDPAFEAAISTSQEKQQQLITAQNEFNIAQVKANQTIVQAEAQAKAVELLAKASSNQDNSQAYLFLEWLKVWDGKLPIYYSSGTNNNPSLFIGPPAPK